jgi:Flp pilus assembly protein TadG
MIRGHRRNEHLASESGQAMVEFALILPVLLLLVMGIIYFGTAFNYWNNLNQIAGDVARKAAVNALPSGSNLASYVQGLSNAPGTTVCVTFPATPTNRTPKAGDAVKITTSASAWPSLAKFLGLSAQTIVRGSATMRLEQDPSFTYVNPSSC